MTDSDQQPDPPSRSDAIIQRLKVAHERRGKYRLQTLFVMISLIAVLLATLRATVGFDFVVPLLFPALVFLYSFAPVVCWVVVTLGLTFLHPTTRFRIISRSVFLIAAVFWLVYLVNFDTESKDLLLDIIFGVVCTGIFWLLQIAIIAGTRRLLFHGEVSLHEKSVPAPPVRRSKQESKPLHDD